MNTNEIDIRDQSHLMDAEGAHSEKPEESEIIRYLEDKGYLVDTIDMWHDEMMGLWRWTTNIRTHH